ncbi:MAG: hypothetical protein U0936_27180 [Planctomycetaceae bacterium]
MDKLQPLIKHRYWICFALSVVFVVVGWWKASGAIAIEIEDRMKKVDESFTKATQGATKPNKSWVDAAKKENEADTQSYDRASKQLLQRQKNARKWPDALVSSMKGISYRQDVKDTITRARWASIYRDQIEQLLQIVKPFKNGEGLVLVDTAKISHKPFNSWRTSRPSSTEIWNCQEDIWLLESLLNSIARVNEGATRLTEAQIRQIFRLHLRGGDRDAAAASSAGGGGMGGMGMPMESGAFMPAGVAPGGGAMGGAGGASSYPGKEFEGSAGNDILTEEFGAFTAGGGAQGAMGGMGGMGAMSSMPMAMGGGPESMSMGGGSPAAPVEEKRYVDGGDGDTTLGYKTRAFLLDVLIRDDQVPNLLASLTNSDFPVEIVRVEIVSKFTPSKSAMSMTGGAGMGEMESGMGMGSGMPGMDSMSGYSEGGGFGAGGEMSFSGASELGNEGAGALGQFGGDYDPGSLAGAGAPGMTSGMPGMGATAAGTKGKEVIQAAMNDPLLVLVKIGGLMTLYQSAQEANAEATTAETDQAAAPAATPPAEGTPAEGTPAEGTPAEGTPAEGTPAEGTPAEGTPAEGTPAEGTPSTEPTPSPGAENPETPTTPAPEGTKTSEGTSPLPAEGVPGSAVPEPGTPATPEPAVPEEKPTAGADSPEPTPAPEGAPPVQP